MRKPKVCILRAAGTNCDKETVFAFIKVGAEAELVHINSFISGERELSDYHILAIPGGFTYGDDIAAGKILANEFRFKLRDQLTDFINKGSLIIGICNGFQVLVKSGLLPGNSDFKQEASLIINDSGKFEDRWVYLRTSYIVHRTSQNKNKCVWTKNLPEVIYLPVAHGEGKFVTGDKEVLRRLRRHKQIVFQYCNETGDSQRYPYNPNGSIENIAGICDETGRIFGLMPHPERHIDVTQHPCWLRKGMGQAGCGLQIFKNGVDYIKRSI